MKIIQNNYIDDCIEEDTSQEIICEHCNSVFEIDDNDKLYDKEGDVYIYCPCCYNKVYITEEQLTKNNLKFPNNYFHYANGVEINNGTIDKWVKESIEWLEKYPNEPFRYIGSGDSVAIVFNHKDEYYIIVAKKYFDVSIDK